MTTIVKFIVISSFRSVGIFYTFISSSNYFWHKGLILRNYYILAWGLLNMRGILRNL